MCNTQCAFSLHFPPLIMNKQKIYFSALRRDAKTLKLIFSYGFFVSLLDDKTCCKYVKTTVEKTEEGKRKTLEVY
jgi:hypothetical protein